MEVKKNIYLNLKPVLGIHDQMVLVVSVEITIAAVEYLRIQIILKIKIKIRAGNFGRKKILQRPWT